MGEADTKTALAPTLTAVDTSAASTPPPAPVIRDSAASLIIGTRIGDRYDVRGYLGRGGMGAVYRAFDAVLGVEVALKVVRRSFAAELRDEVRVAQGITHPNVCRTYDLEEVEGRQFVKMEFIDGETIAALIAKHGALPFPEVIRIAREVAAGLAAAHRTGIVHRDLKPANVMLSGERVVLMDFGLARPMVGSAADRAGTPSYMSPEQLAGRDLDGRSDLFSLGCLLYEMLTGERAFDAGRRSTTETGSEREALPAPDVRAKRRGTPRWLVQSLNGLMSHEPARRPHGVDRLRRGPDRTWIALVALAVVMLAAFGWWWMQPGAPWRARTEEVIDYVGNADSPSLSADGRTVLFSLDAGENQNWAVFTVPIEGGSTRQVSMPGTHCVLGRWASDGRSVLTSCMRDGVRRIYHQPLDGRPPVDLGPGLTAQACGDAIAMVLPDSRERKLVLRYPDGRETLIARGARIGFLRCARDGHQLLFGYVSAGLGSGRLMLSDREGRVRELVSEGALSGAFTEDGLSVVFARKAGNKTTLVELELATGALHEVAPEDVHARAPDVSSDGKTLIYHRDVTSCPVYELDASGKGTPRTMARACFDQLSVAPGAQVVVATQIDRDPTAVVAIEVATGAVRTLADGDRPFASLDGKRVLFRSLRDPATLLSVPMNGGPVTTVAQLPAEITSGVDGPDGAHVALARGELGEAWLVPHGGGAPIAEKTAGLVHVAPGGGWRAVVLESGGRTTVRFVAPGEPLSSAAFERHGLGGRGTWVDDLHFSYCDAKRCYVVDVISRSNREGPAHPLVLHPEQIAAAPDGQRWFYTPLPATVSLHKITNFGERPWKPRRR